MQQPVQDCGGDEPSAEHLPRCCEALIAGQNHLAALVPAAHQLEEQMLDAGRWQDSDSPIAPGDLVQIQVAAGRLRFDLEFI